MRYKVVTLSGGILRLGVHKMNASTQLALMIDLERCTGCKSCEAACKQTNALGPQTYRNKVMWFDEQQLPSGDKTTLPRLDFLTVTCQQCERPACLRACPVTPKAISKDPITGVVSIDEDRCTGCGECALSCPYGAIGYNAEQHHAVKCDLCADRRLKNLEPACASVCPTRAISFNTRDKLIKQANKDDREILETDHFLQKPATLYLKRLIDHGDNIEDNSVGISLINDQKARHNLESSLATGSYRQAEKLKQQQQPVKIVPGACNICFNGCPVKYHISGNKVVHVYGNEEDPQFQGRICSKSQMTLQLYDNPHRLTHPLKRVGPRGSDNFIAISWQQAMNEISAKLSKIRQAHGSEALAIQAGSRTGVLNTVGAIRLFSRLWGTANIATSEPLCDLGKGIALDLTQGNGMLPNTFTKEDIGQAQVYVFIGDNQAETRPVNFGLLNDWRINNKAKMIVVDPRLTVTASKADDWLAIRSGTDMALGLALIHSIFKANLHNVAFCERWVEGWKVWRDFIIDKNYNAQWAESITDISAKKTQALAKTIAQADGCMIFLSRGINQHTNSVQTNRVFMFIAAITGNWGRKGGGYFNVSSDTRWKPFDIPKDREPKIKPAVGINPIDWLAAMKSDAKAPIKALITGNNPLAQWPEQIKVREALLKLDLIVHMELFKNATSHYADYVLPMATGIEKGGPARFTEDRRFVWNDKLIDPPGEAKSDHWFWIELGKKFGFDDILKEDYKQPRKLWDEVIVAPTPYLQGAETKNLLKQANRTIRVPVFNGDEGEIDPVYITEKQSKEINTKVCYETPSGKLEFWTQKIEDDFQLKGLSSLPEFYSEQEQLIDLPYIEKNSSSVISPFHFRPSFTFGGSIVTAPTDKAQLLEFDTELITGRPPAPHFHSWTHYFWQAQEMWPELYCQIHPSKAAKLNIKEGDNIIIATRLGRIKAKAWLHLGIRVSSVFVPIGWDETQPFHPTLGVNHLINAYLDPISQQANLKTHLCRIYKP